MSAQIFQRTECIHQTIEAIPTLKDLSEHGSGNINIRRLKTNEIKKFFKENLEKLYLDEEIKF